MIKLFLSIAFIGCIVSAEYISVPKTSLISVHDGDTFKIDLPCEISTVCKAIPVRVNGIDTPEISSKNLHEKELAVKAKAFTISFMHDSTSNLEMDCKRDKYFRINCSVKTNAGDLGSELIAAKLAKPYDGGTKNTDWSKY